MNGAEHADRPLGKENPVAMVQGNVEPISDAIKLLPRHLKDGSLIKTGLYRRSIDLVEWAEREEKSEMTLRQTLRGSDNLLESVDE